MADTFIQAVKELCDSVAGITSVVLDQRPEDAPQLPADVLIHLGQIPTQFNGCGQKPSYADDRVELLIYRSSLPECESLAQAVATAWNTALLAWVGVDLTVAYRDLYRAGMVTHSDGSPMRSASGQSVYLAQLQWVVQYRPAF